MIPASRFRTLLSLMCFVVLAACQPGTEQTPAEEPVSVIAEAAGVRVAMLPAGFDVASNDASGLHLTAAPSGTVEITLGDVERGGLNIVETVKSELAAFESLPDGQSFGQNQLVAPIGLTYVARGRYSAEGDTTEELLALVVHPWGNRLLTVAYRYPLGEDTSERASHLMELLGEIEPLDAPQPDDSPEGS